jgi:hypothetical protein
MRNLLPVVLTIALFASPDAVFAQGSTSQRSPCTDQSYRALDFWLGEWRVESAGREVGRNRITREQGGCVVVERWRSSASSEGMSMNFFSPTTGRWHQTWVDNGGTVLQLVGTVDSAAMIYRGETRTARGHFVHRLSLRARADGTVHQLWEAWPVADTSASARRVAFDGIYRRVK